VGILCTDQGYTADAAAHDSSTVFNLINEPRINGRRKTFLRWCCCCVADRVVPSQFEPVVSMSDRHSGSMGGSLRSSRRSRSSNMAVMQQTLHHQTSSGTPRQPYTETARAQPLPAPEAADLRDTTRNFIMETSSKSTSSGSHTARALLESSTTSTSSRAAADSARLAGMGGNNSVSDATPWAVGRDSFLDGAEQPTPRAVVDGEWLVKPLALSSPRKLKQSHGPPPSSEQATES
jgi:hypothetical protein